MQVERTGYRDLIFNMWHRLIPHLRMIDLDFVQTCKVCSKPLLLCELTRANKVKRTKILRLASEAAGVQGVLINYYPRWPKHAFDDTHGQYLRYIYHLESKLKRLSKMRIAAINAMYRYCINQHGERQAYDAMIRLVGFQKISPDSSDYQVLDSTYPIKLAMEGYRYCGDECEAVDKSRPNPMPEILRPNRDGFNIASLEFDVRQLPLLSLESLSTGKWL